MWRATGYSDQTLASHNPSGLALLPYIRPENHDSAVYCFIDVSHDDADVDNPNTYRYIASDAPGLDQFDGLHL